MVNRNTDPKFVLSAKKHILNEEREIVDRAISDQITTGKNISTNFKVTYSIEYTEQFVTSFTREFDAWNKFNIELLSLEFTDTKILNEYLETAVAPAEYDSDMQRGAFLERLIEARIACLESIRKRLVLYEKVVRAATSEQINTKHAVRKVFIVHGHDEGAKQSVARLLEHQGIQPVILHEIENRTRTVIEKLEEESLDAGYAIILLTPDDEGKSVRDNKPKPRSRQNVILELGFFIAKIGRRKVCALYSEGVEIPTDFDGVLYTKLDIEGAWQTKLLKEIKAAGFIVDFNKLS